MTSDVDIGESPMWNHTFTVLRPDSPPLRAIVTGQWPKDLRRPARFQAEQDSRRAVAHAPPDTADRSIDHRPPTRVTGPAIPAATTDQPMWIPGS
ncbi:hypothetical protein [Nocardia seriolae]|uniref:hypothetical protein n=1 Tax=Nocardia seriolae TaxID=37332 RepID=UPI00051A8490|nr:hypothetical protein [Nocardia seriolae]MTJ64462.1 hypothetical protein [Nocardia seriolae]MTJ73439.1 hypothetical protein [Nocardia seriolae]MTJ87544.1 hypothetical protein [Nocardia seriolae]MTK31535.1 hypothetical protein [Nocardia seriolae]MTK42334.1 hypothetical protein [Nocardia seriolae]